MTRRTLASMGLMFCGVIMTIDISSAQIALPDAKAPDGATIFKQQCAVCHTVNRSDAQRQGPTLAKVVGRKAGSIDGFKYSAGFAKADFVWDEAKLDAWLTHPQAIIPGTIMAYKQARPEIRAAIITYLKGLN